MIKNVSYTVSINEVRLSVNNLTMYQDYSAYEIRLANEIAEILGDRDSLALHLQYARKYKEEYLRKVLNKVMSLDEKKIRKSRAALYTYLINQGARHGGAGH